MLNKLFTIVGVLVVILIALLLIDVFFVGFKVNDTNRLEIKAAQKNTSLSITSVNKENNQLIFLIKIKNNAATEVFLGGLVVNVLNDSNEIIDKCSANLTGMVTRRVAAKTENTVKVICENMQLSAKYKGEVKYNAKFEGGF